MEKLPFTAFLCMNACVFNEGACMLAQTAGLSTISKMRDCWTVYSFQHERMCFYWDMDGLAEEKTHLSLLHELGKPFASLHQFVVGP